MTTETSPPWVARPSKGRALALVALAAVIGLTVVAGGVVWWLNSSVDRVGVDGLGEGGSGGLGSEAEASEDDEDWRNDVDPSSLTVLVLGSDSRDVLTPEERVELSTGYAEGERTEVMALTRLDPHTGEVRVLSVPRDSLVRRCDDTQGRVNAAYSIGELDEPGTGASCVVETLRDWLGVRIDHVIKVDFRGFVDIVDALGGVSMYIEEPLQDERANLDLDEGCQRLDGAQSLAFVRARSIDSDFGRMERQHRFVTELRDELADKGALSDLAGMFRVAEATARAVELDDSLTIGRIQQLVRNHRDTIRGEIHGRTLEGEIERIDGISFLRIDEERAAELVRWFVTGRDVAEARDHPLDAEGDDEGTGGNGRPSGDEGSTDPSDGGGATDADEPSDRARC